MAGPGVHLVVLVRRSSPKKSRDAAFQSAADESIGTDLGARRSGCPHPSSRSEVDPRLQCLQNADLFTDAGSGPFGRPADWVGQRSPGTSTGWLSLINV